MAQMTRLCLKIVANASTFDEVTVLAEKLMEEDSESIKGDETESMRHAVKLPKGSTST